MSQMPATRAHCERMPPERERPLPAIFSVTTLLRILLCFNSFRTPALVDTGAAVSLIAYDLLRKLPEECVEKTKQFDENGPKFRTAAGQLMRSLEINTLTFTVNGFSFSFRFHVVDALEEDIILGIDFLKTYKFHIDVGNNSLYCTNQNVRNTLESIEPLKIASIGLEFDSSRYNLDNIMSEYRPKLRQLLEKYDGLLPTKLIELGTETAVKHAIHIVDSPVNLLSRRTPIALRDEVKKHVDEMLANGIIRESSSPYASLS